VEDFKFDWTPGSRPAPRASTFPDIRQPRLAVHVSCGGCGRELTVTHVGWHVDRAVHCPDCDAGADLEHARAHVDCGICEESE
jgi:ribosomal protein S27E